MAKRITEQHKRDLVENFESGKSIDFLSKLFDCTKLTVTRNLKKILGEFKYKEIINKNKNLNSEPAQKEKFKDKKAFLESITKLSGKIFSKQGNSKKDGEKYW